MARDLAYEIKGLVPATVTLKLAADLRITEDIDTEVDTAAINFGYYAILAEKADTRYQKVKFAFEAWVAETEARALRQRQAEGLKAYTEAQMKSYVRSQSKYRGYQMKLLELDEQKRILKVISKAFEMKKDMVQTKASNRRSEIKVPSGKGRTI
jgi:hypothetical protein